MAHLAEQAAFHYAGIELRFEGEGENEKGIDIKTGKTLVEVSPDFYRPTDVVNLWGDPSKAKRELGWEAEYGIDEMCRDSWNWQSHNPDGYKTAE